MKLTIIFLHRYNCYTTKRYLIDAKEHLDIRQLLYFISIELYLLIKNKVDDEKLKTTNT